MVHLLSLLRFRLPTALWVVGGLLTVAFGAVLARLELEGFAFSVAALGFLALAAATVRSPLVGIAAVAFFLPFERFGSLEVAGFTLRVSQVLGAVTMVSAVIALLHRRPWRPRPNPIFLPTVALLLIGAWSATQAINPERAALVLLFTAFTIAVSWVVIEFVRTRAMLERVVAILFLTTLLVCAFGVFQFVGDLVGLPPSVTGLRDLYTKEVFGFPRVQSTTLEPLYFANFLLIPLALSAALLLGRARTKTALLVLVVIAALTNIVLTLSRGGWLAAAASLLVVVVLFLPRLFSFRQVVIGLAVAAAVTFGVLRAFSYTQNSDVSLETFRRQAVALFAGASYFDREATFRQAWELFQAHPVLGIGIGNFGPEVAANPVVAPTGGWLIVNNEFLEVSAETGVVGFAFFLVLLGVLTVRSLHAIAAARDPWLKSMAVGLFAAFVGVIVQWQTFSTLYIMHIWFLVGLLVAVQNLILNPQENGGGAHSR